jgi:Zn-dependent membrane protease YugP
VIRKISWTLTLIGLITASLYSVRIGAITLAIALTLYTIPDFRSRRTVEKLVPVALIVSLITVALALPRR